MSEAEFKGPGFEPGNREEAAMPSGAAQELSPAGAAKRKRHAELMAIDGVEGVGTGQDALGNEGIVVYVRDEEVVKRVPPVIDGLKVQVQVTGPIHAQTPGRK